MDAMTKLDIFQNTLKPSRDVKCVTVMSFVRPTYAVQTFAFYIHVGDRVVSSNFAVMVDVLSKGGLVWVECLFCQYASSENLVCPAKSKRMAVGIGYIILSVDLHGFK